MTAWFWAAVVLLLAVWILALAAMAAWTRELLTQNDEGRRS